MTSRFSASTVGAICVLVASTIWGTTGTTATFATGVSPLGIGAVTMGLGGLLLALTAAMSIHRDRVAIARQLPALAVGAASVGVYPLAFYSSMHLTGVAIGTVVSIGSAPLAASVVEWLFDGQRLTRRWCMGALTGLAGAVLLSFGRDAAHGSTVPDSMAMVLGIALGLLAGVTYAVYSWAARRLMQGGASPRAAMGSVFGLGGMLLLPVLAVTGQPFLASTTTMAVAAYMVLVPVLVAYILFAYGLARVSATMATTLSLLEPVIAAVLAVAVVGERLSPGGWLGISLIVACLFILTVTPVREPAGARQ